MSSSSSTNIKVGVRVRPALHREISPNGSFNACIGLRPSKSRIYVTTSDKPILVNKEDVNDSFNKRTQCINYTYNHVFSSESSTEHVYNTMCKSATEDILNGINSTVFGYGQTGTGKTHTMFGSSFQPGLAVLFMNDLLLSTCNNDFNISQVSIKVSYLQLYRGHVTDLLAPKNSLNVNVKDLTILRKETVKSQRDLLKVITNGSRNRKTVSTQLNSTSSRSHAVLTFYVETQKKESNILTTAKLHVVDLAGSERVKDSGVSGSDLKDAASINLSLFYLAGVVKALVKGNENIPYNSSRLTQILRDALGGNCKTILIATCSPAFIHAQETISTLKFANACSKIKNRAIVNQKLMVPRKRPWQNIGKNDEKGSGKGEKKEKRTSLPWENTLSPRGGRRTVNAGKFGMLSCLAYGDPSKPLCLCLHGHPSDAEYAYGDFLLKALVISGHYYAVALDMPGRGESVGNQLKTRSEFNLQKDGAADIIANVIKGFGKKSSILIGYDWGAGIAISMASCKKFRKMVTHVVCFHPSFNETENGQLKSISANFFLIWCKQDLFHNYKKWKGNANILSSSLGPSRYEQHIFNEKCWSKNGWRVNHKSDIERRILTFLTGNDPVPKVKDVFVRPKVSTKDANGVDIARFENIVFAEDVVEGKYNKECFKAPNFGKEAITRMKNLIENKKLVEKGVLKEMYTAFATGNGFKRQEAARLFSALPLLTPTLLYDPMKLVELGIWKEIPTAWHAANQSCRYFAGQRNILVRAPVENLSSSPAFLTIPSGHRKKGEKSNNLLYTTLWTQIINIEKEVCVVNIESTNSCGKSVKPYRLRVKKSEIERMNQPQLFPKSPRNDTAYIFEDGLCIDYKSPIVRAKMCEISIRLSDLVRELDFDVCTERITLKQIEAIHIIRDCIDMNTFQKDNGTRERNRERYCGNDIGRFAVFGQGHCHTVTSVMAAFLWPFSKALHIDVKYRGGFSFSRETAVRVQDSPEHHQWLEFTCRPSMKTFTCDLYREDGPNGGKGNYLAKPIQETYLNDLYAHCKLMKFSDVSVVKVEKAAVSDWGEGTSTPIK